MIGYLVEGAFVKLACGWTVGPIKNLTGTPGSPYAGSWNKTRWSADNHTCGFALEWNGGGEHLGNVKLDSHDLHVVEVINGNR